jgi:hypothetical protein
MSFPAGRPACCRPACPALIAILGSRFHLALLKGGYFDNDRDEIPTSSHEKGESTMKFPVCDFAESEDGFYSQCASCPIDAKNAGCALDELGDGTYEFQGETPNGGVRAIFHFKNDAGDQVAKPDAVHVEIHELDENGHLIAILYGMVDPEGMIYLKKSDRGI